MGAAFFLILLRLRHGAPLEVGYVLPESVQVVDTPAEVRIVLGLVKGGERVEILKRTHNWAQIRTADNLTGWIENVSLLDAQIYEGGQKLLRDLRDIPSQAEGHTGGVVNLHLEPSRDAAQLAQLPADLKVEVYGRRLVDRPAPEGQPTAPKVRDVWYLIRAESRAGWIMGRFVALDAPAVLATYAQGANMVAWLVLKKVDDEGQAVPEYLTAERLGTQEADFSHIRVFTWWIKDHKYVTAYAESGLTGYFPIRTSEVDGVPYFRLRLMDDAGQKYQKVYGLFDTITRVVGTVPGWESDAMPASPAPRRHRRSEKRKG